MIRIGPAGNSAAFYATGRKSTLQAAEWLREIGLNAFEYSFGRGVNISDASAAAIGAEMKKYDIMVSGHAPYYINFASPKPELIQKSWDYIRRSLKKVGLMGGNRVVFHAAVQGKLSREEAMSLTKSNIEQMLDYIEKCLANGFQAAEILPQDEQNNQSQELQDSQSKAVHETSPNPDLFDIAKRSFILCPETMGKFSQIGTVEEIVEICKLHPMLYPCFDFGHINCIMQGGLKDYDDYRRIIDYTLDHLGKEKTFNMHIHFSKIQYGSIGEIRHLTLADKDFGPEYPPLARVINDYNLTPTIICESRDTMSDDALQMLAYHKAL